MTIAAPGSTKTTVELARTTPSAPTRDSTATTTTTTDFVMSRPGDSCTASCRSASICFSLASASLWPKPVQREDRPKCQTGPCSNSLRLSWSTARPTKTTMLNLKQINQSSITAFGARYFGQFFYDEIHCISQTR